MTGVLHIPRPRLAIASQYTPVQEYYERLEDCRPSYLIGYWPLWDASGVAAEERRSVDDGTYSGATLGSTGIGDGRTCLEFDGVNDYCDIYSAALSSAFDGAEGTAMIWAKVDGAARWTDGSSDDMFTLTGDNASTQYMRVRKSSTNNEISYYRWMTVGKFKTINHTCSSTGWMHLAITWSVAADYFKAWYNGALVDTSLGIGAYSGPMSSSGNVLGASNKTPTNCFDGWLAHFAIWTVPLSSSEIADLAGV